MSEPQEYTGVFALEIRGIQRAYNMECDVCGHTVETREMSSDMDKLVIIALIMRMIDQFEEHALSQHGTISVVEIPNPELPGLWEPVDLSGGLADTQAELEERWIEKHGPVV